MVPIDTANEPFCAHFFDLRQVNPDLLVAVVLPLPAPLDSDGTFTLALDPNRNPALLDAFAWHAYRKNYLRQKTVVTALQVTLDVIPMQRVERTLVTRRPIAGVVRKFVCDRDARQVL